MNFLERLMRKGRSSKGSATKAEQHNNLSESITSQKTSLVIEKHRKRHKSARLDFSGVKGLYTYLVITTSLMEIKPLQATKEGHLLAHNRLSQL
jgi:hypothetical protein